ncbi:MAG: adenylate/guanylate cyclase domain-containing protein [Leptospirales bacterium]|nr:adenylate/guanylate cyclase domain-containing protein [Leptospirales bacterium]
MSSTIRIERKIRSKTLRTALNASLFSGIVSAVVSAAATAIAYPDLPLLESAPLGALSGLVIGSLIPATLFLLNFTLVNPAHFRKMPYYAFLLLSGGLLIAVTMAVYFLVGSVVFPDRLLDSSQLALAFGLSGFLAVTMSLSSVVRSLAGPGVVGAIVSGRYHQAFETECAFLFIDLSSSTGIAERLGSARFFRMINEFHAIVDSCCLYYDGTLYKYLGDGAILVWTADRCSRALQCVEEIALQLELRAEEFNREYGTPANFTAGLHCGKVITGEIGDQRREIGYWGDTVNAAARIQSACKEYKTTFLISADAVARLAESERPRCRSVGLASLRGKTQSLELFRALD